MSDKTIMRLMGLGFVIAFVTIIVALTYRTLSQETACEERGGVSVNIRGSIVCFNKDVLR